jgi:murein DD-endopeptidase MepM/ murein hydrolase activator NlpD
VRKIEVRLRHEKGEQLLFETAYPGNPLTGGAVKPGPDPIEIAVVPKALGMRDGEAALEVTATDWSWRHALSGNSRLLAIPIRVDLKPPLIAVENGLTYLRRGGAGAVVYSLGEPASRDGVEVGGVFFPGVPFPVEGSDQVSGAPAAGRRFALFAIPRDAPANPAIHVVGVDEAGNRTAAGWMTRLQERQFAEVRIDLGGEFLSSKVPELAMNLGIEQTDPVSTFQRINSEARAASEARIREIVATPSPEKLWSGAFQQLRDSKVTSLFAEHRSYFAEGKKVSEAIHYGYDLASLARAPITVANAGRVIFAESLGIYGNSVIVDHGLGVTTLYSHLSQIDVREGDLLEKDQRLGLSGATGLAGGDHLHYAVLVGDTYVDPVEWWDPKWVREHVEDLLATRSP